MERGVKHRPHRRSPLPFLLLAVAVVGCAFAVAVATVVPMDADSPGGQDQALPAPTLEKAERDKLDAPTAATPTPIRRFLCVRGGEARHIAHLGI